ncbi:MAG: hypothetical protein V4581_16800 [Bacteroidota bacterium]
MKEEDEITGKITPQDAMRMLEGEGLIITLEEATNILTILRKIANIAVSKYLER